MAIATFGEDLERWRERVAASSEREATFSTLSGVEVRPLYTDADVPDRARIAVPGEFPFTRGVYPSMYTEGDEEPLELLHVAPALERKQVGCLQAVRGRRDGSAVERELAALKAAAARPAAARPDVNMMPLLLDCARAHVTEGEIVGALQEVWGRYTELPVF